MIILSMFGFFCSSCTYRWLGITVKHCHPCLFSLVSNRKGSFA